MKALAILGLIFSSLSIFIPVMGIIIGLICSFMALISFRSQSTISGITFGINIISTAFLSPLLLISDVASSTASYGISTDDFPTEAGEIYWFYVGYHLIFLILALLWRAIKGPPNKNLNDS